MENSENHFDVIVIGAGAAGLTAGIYLSRARLKTLILEQNMVGGADGANARNCQLSRRGVNLGIWIIDGHEKAGAVVWLQS